MALETPRARYQQVADELREAIKRGEFPPGTMLPSQPDLARKYDLNQTSINRAIAVLRSEGLVRIERGRGAFVLEIPTVKRVRRIDRDYRRDADTASSYAEEMRRAGLRPQTELVRADADIPPAEVAEALHLDESAQTLVRKRHMFAEGTPVQIATSYIPMEFAGSVELAYPDTGPTGIYARLAERGYGPVRFTEEIEARPPTSEEASFLHIPEGQPVFNVLRIAFDAEDRRVEACTNVLAALQWRLTYSWSQEHRASE